MRCAGSGMSQRTRRGGRPPLTTEVIRVRVTLSLRVGEDDDLIDWFAQLPPRQRPRYLKGALRQGGATIEDTAPAYEEVVDDATFADLLDAL